MIVMQVSCYSTVVTDYSHLKMTFLLFVRLLSTGTTISWCAFRKERRRIEDGLTGLKEMSFIWYESTVLILLGPYSPLSICDQ